jgi:hypothetical protein
LAVLARFSAVPAHCRSLRFIYNMLSVQIVTTTVFATCGLNFWVFLGAVVVSLPKQLGSVAGGGKALNNYVEVPKLTHGLNSLGSFL